MGLLGGLCAWEPAVADDKDRCTVVNGGYVRLSESIGLIGSQKLLRGAAKRAVEQWAGCPGYGTDFPAFRLGSEGTQTVEVTFAARGVGRRCGSFTGRKITLFAFARDGHGRPQSCGSPADGLAHELGHVLGLRDAPDGDLCRDHIMASVDVTDRNRRRVEPEVCRAVGERWQTPVE